MTATRSRRQTPNGPASKTRFWARFTGCPKCNSAWLCLRRDVFERLYRYKVRRGIPTFEQALERVVPDVRAEMEEPKVEEPNGKETIH